MTELTGKVAVITGAGGGIGRGIALSMAEAGAMVGVSDLVLERANETVELLHARGYEAFAQRADVRELESVEALADATVRRFGALDIVVANAGIIRFGSVLTLSSEDWEAGLQVNLTGVFYTVQAAAREMVRLGKGGRVITISSLAAETAAPRWSNYMATKAAVRHATRCWAFDLAGFDITVNSIGPGWIETPLIDDLKGDGAALEQFTKSVPLGRLGQPEDVGAMATWLASAAARHVTGSYFLLDGGQHDGLSASPTVAMYRSLAQELQGDALLAEIDRLAGDEADRQVEVRRSSGLF